MLYQDKCALSQSQGNMNGQNVSWAQNSNKTCETTARDIANKGRVDLGCRYMYMMNYDPFVNNDFDKNVIKINGELRM